MQPGEQTSTQKRAASNETLPRANGREELQHAGSYFRCRSTRTVRGTTCEESRYASTSSRMPHAPRPRQAIIFSPASHIFPGQGEIFLPLQFRLRGP